MPTFLPRPARESITRVVFGCALALSSLAVQAAIPASYQFQGLRDKLSESPFNTSAFAEAYGDGVLSVGTAVNNANQIMGFWMDGDEVFTTFSIGFGDNPLSASRKTQNFVGVAGGEPACNSLIGLFTGCAYEYPYGVRILPATTAGTPDSVVAAFLNTPFSSTAVSGSIPYLFYPGNFVEENAAGIVASTQQSLDAQFGVILREVVEVVIGGPDIRSTLAITLDDVPWLIGINDLAEPLVIGYDGTGDADGNCLVYGPGCKPPVNACDYDANPGNGGQNGNEESGNRWGHNKCKDGVSDGNNGGGTNGSGATATTTESGVTRAGDVTASSGALLLHLRADNTVQRYRFPTSVPLGLVAGTASKVFPVAINNARVVLRGDVKLGDTTLDNRLLSCRFNSEQLDTDTDLVVDCIDGLELVGGLQNSIRVGTVLGFTLNNDDLLVGNLGYNTSGVGLPVVVNLATVTPAAEWVGNLAAGTRGWELNTITDMNASGRMTGYGYKDCSLEPEAFYIVPQASEPQAGVRFQRGAFEYPGYLRERTPLRLQPTLAGGSGAYEVRVSIKTPDEAAWELLADWSADAGTWNPGSFQGVVCFLVEARDPAAPAAQPQHMVVRYSVGVNPPGGSPLNNTGTEILTPGEGNYDVGQLLAGGISLHALFLLGIAGLLRRRRQ